jgi:hypothetical protein
MKHTSFHPFLDLTPPTWLRLAALGSSVQKHFANWSVRACDALILSTEPRITQKKDPSGHSYFVIYDPYDRSRHTFLTEEAVRVWLEKRYSC